MSQARLTTAEGLAPKRLATSVISRRHFFVEQHRLLHRIHHRAARDGGRALGVDQLERVFPGLASLDALEGQVSTRSSTMSERPLSCASASAMTSALTSFARERTSSGAPGRRAPGLFERGGLRCNGPELQTVWFTNDRRGRGARRSCEEPGR